MTIDTELFNKNTKIYSKKYNLIAGVDEVGRGPLAGAVIAAAVILPKEHTIRFLTDSKKLTEKRREIAYQDIKEQALYYAFGRAECDEIDEINILQASLKAMSRAVMGLLQRPEFVLVDGNKLPDCGGIPGKAVVKGDLYEDAISAAAILAKVERDREMQAFDLKYPEYGFAKHKGYPTKEHLMAIEEHGITPIHRCSFAPVRKIIELSNV